MAQGEIYYYINKYRILQCLYINKIVLNFDKKGLGLYFYGWKKTLDGLLLYLSYRQERGGELVLQTGGGGGVEEKGFKRYDLRIKKNKIVKCLLKEREKLAKVCIGNGNQRMYAEWLMFPACF